MQVFPQQKCRGSCRGWYARQEVCQHVKIAWVSRKLYKTREDFDLGRMKQKDRDVSEKNHTVTTVCVHFRHLWLTLTLPICTFWGDKKQTRKEDYIFIHKCCSWSYLYTTPVSNTYRQLVSLVWFYSISTIVGYLIPNPLLNI